MLQYLGTSVFPDFTTRFLPFADDSPLPPCRFRFLDCPDGLLDGRTCAFQGGNFSFYLSREGIMIASSVAVVEVCDHFSVVNCYIRDGLSRIDEMALAFQLLQGYRYVIAYAGQFQMHSAVTVYNGYGIAFCGRSGAGKSTQVRQWEKYLGAAPLNMDQPVILFDNGDVFVSGSPWSGKEPCYINRQVPLRALFFVEQAPENSVTLLPPSVSYTLLYKYNYLFPINDEIAHKHEEAIRFVAERVPAYRLRCTISEQAVELARDAAFSDKE